MVCVLPGRLDVRANSPPPLLPPLLPPPPVRKIKDDKALINDDFPVLDRPKKATSGVPSVGGS